VLRQILLICSLFAGFSTYVCAQTSEGFDDGNFTFDPIWTGDDSLFRINTLFQLQSKGSVSKDIYLSTPLSESQNEEWNLWCRFNLSPSASNFCRYFLMSDSINLKGKLNGYYVQFGGVSGSSDSITLYKQKGTTRTRIIGGRPATVSKTVNVVRIRVLRDAVGNWQLYSDTTGGTDLILEGSGPDAEFSTGSFMGISVKYTSGNAANYFFDDMYAGPVIIDNLPPRIDSIRILSASQIRVIFNENVDAITALDALNYSINNGIGGPASVVFETGKNNTVLLDLNMPLPNGIYELGVAGIKDRANNILVSQQVGFKYYISNAQENDVLISEFFPDPTPSEGLPEHEYIELYNRTGQVVPLKNWTIGDETFSTALPDILLGPDSFIILCDVDYETEFANWGITAAVASLPSLNNTADVIVLKDDKGKIIHHIQYDLNWYNDGLKDAGGWSIEMDNPFDLCKGKANYAASFNNNGGSPGTANSRWSKVPDTMPPVVLSVTALSDTMIAAVFNEHMDSLSLLTASVTASGGTTVTGRYVTGESHDTLLLSVTPMAMNVDYLLNIDGAKDCNQNAMVSVTKQFTRYVPADAQAYDVLINEVMADPDPVIAAPDAEYIELFNRSSKVISLKGWTLSDNGSGIVFPEYFLLPDSFLTITATANHLEFLNYPNTIALTGFPSLGNDGDVLTLRDEKGKVVHHMSYSSAVYKDNLKKNGGWSIELIDPDNPCGGEQNYTASKDPKGGTPGKRNASHAHNPDNDAPKLLSAYPLNENELKLTFSESMDSTCMLDLKHFYMNAGSLIPNEIYQRGPMYTEVVLSFSEPLQIQNLYRVIADSVRDCAGNYITYDDYADFGIPEPFDSFDIAINEILFNPKAGGSDYIEILNRTDKMIDLKDIYVANADADGQVRDLFPVAPNGFLLFPHAYAVITDDPFAVQTMYFTPNPKNVIKCTMPSFNDDEGKCLLINMLGKRYDQLNYDDNMHFALLDEKGGVSLERIDYNRSSKDYSNWTSASSTSGFGTPTYRNSQYAKAAGGEEMLKIQPEVFSPDGDGFNDVVTFNYALSKPGCVGNLYIYDAAGMMVKHLLRNEILGTTGSFSWDGVTDELDKATIGIYVCYFEVFNIKGSVSKKKKTLVVGGKM
jgi:hypothetical protein